MNIKESGLKIVSLIRASQIKTEKHQDGFSGYFEIDVKLLDNDEKNLLEELLVGKFSHDVFKCYIADNNEEPIIFIEESDAIGTLTKEAPSLQKKFQFALFSQKGVMINPPKSQVISFIPKR